MENRTPARPSRDPWEHQGMRCAAIAVFALLLMGGVHASESLEIEYYEVHGNSAQEVREWMDRNGPVGKDGRRFHGYTKWNVRWSFRYRPRGASCEATSVATSLDVIMTLPRWSRPDGAPAVTCWTWASNMTSWKSVALTSATVKSCSVRAARMPRHFYATIWPSQMRSKTVSAERLVCQTLRRRYRRFKKIYPAEIEAGR